MATFYVLPPRPFLGEWYAGYLRTCFPGLDWPRFAEYQFERTTTHGRRRAAEMRESAATLDALGLRGALADAIADIQERMGAVGRASGGDLRAIVGTALAKRID